ncbi:hypothetical protein niasHT_019761 [Heterodera trifolii]|uniref:Protein FAM184A/B N-terminal domain-containing protein n=1 Tax=Heterodera trifolii TaxID=157864 RepID=A0ABD2LC37_9BILA
MNRSSDRPGSSLQANPSSSSSPLPSIAFPRATVASTPQMRPNSPRSVRPSAHSPCPAICSWPAPPVNPRAELKPTAIAAPLTTPAAPPFYSALSAVPAQLSFSNSHLQLQTPNATQSPLFLSPHPSPIPPPLDGQNSPLLTIFRAASFNSAPPAGANSPIGNWGRETELRQKIQSLEEIVADYERQKLNVLGTFTDFRERVSERERQLEAEYSHKIIDLSEEVLGAKRHFEERMKSFQMLQEQFEREKEQALEKLRQDHQREIQALEQRFSQSQLLNLEKKYIMEIQKLEEERNGLRTERERLGEEFKGKLCRAESLFEMELTAAKMLYTRELQALREHEEALKDELAARQEEFHDRVVEMQFQSRQSKDEIVHCREEITQLEKALGQKAEEIQRLSKELAMARRKTEETIYQLDQVKSEAEEATRELSAQRERAQRLNGAEEARERLEETVRELRKELIGLRSKAELLEEERDGLKAQCESQAQLHDSQVTALEAMLQSVTSEKDGCEQRCQELVDRERADAEERELTLRREFSAKLGELEEQYNGLRQHVERENTEHFVPENKLWEEIESLRAEKGELEKELTQQNERTDGMAKLAEEIQKLEKSTMGEKRTTTAEEGEEEEGNDEVPSVEVLLEKLEQLEKSVEGIVREKKRMENRLEQIGEGETVWMKRLIETERELEGQKEHNEKEEEKHRYERERMREQMEALKLELKEQSELETKLREAEKRAEQTETDMDRLIRDMEKRHIMAMEEKINTLNREHERTVELMMQREREMEEKLEEMRKRKRDDGREERTETAVGETQTMEEHWDWDGDDETVREAPLRDTPKEKEELIRKLRQELDEANEAKRVKKPTVGKEGRSQSIASAGEHFSVCQKIFSESAKEEKKECRRPDQIRTFEPRKVSGQLSRMDSTMPRDVPLPAHCSAPSPSGAAPSQRSLLSPGVAQQRRVSPVRQMSANGKNGKGNGGSAAERRPAWKF